MTTEKPFKNRTEAGQRLAERLAMLSLPKDSLVLGLPRGGVVVAYEVAESLRAIGMWYEDFSPVSDRDVQNLLPPAQQRYAPLS